MIIVLFFRRGIMGERELDVDRFIKFFTKKIPYFFTKRIPKLVTVTIPGLFKGKAKNEEGNK